MPKENLSKRVTALEHKLLELWRHESHLADMVLSHLANNTKGEKKPKRDLVIEAVGLERRFQDAKWGPIENQNERDMECWLNCLHEEVKEVEDEDFSGGEGSLDRAMIEMVQVAAVAMACLEQLASEDIVEQVRKHRFGDAVKDV